MLLLALVQAQKEPTARSGGRGSGQSQAGPGTPQLWDLRVQYGAVCQCWLSWVKQVSPGMEQVSLFLILLISFLTFFLLFCSLRSHTFLLRAPSFLNTQGSAPRYLADKGVPTGLDSPSQVEPRSATGLPEGVQSSSSGPQLVLQLGFRPGKEQQQQLEFSLASQELLENVDSQVFGTVTTRRPGPLEVTSDLPQVLDLCLQSLDLPAEEALSPRTVSPTGLDALTSWSMCSLWSFQACRDR